MFDIFKILKFLRKTFSLRDILIITLILLLFFTTRLVNLESLPIFGDEGIYIRWAKTAWKDANWRFISLTDGRQPLQTWATIPFLKAFPENPLFAGRLFGVFSGFLALIGIFTLVFYLFGKRTAYAAALLYLITPMFLFYDRMALADSMVNAGFIWMLFFSILLIKSLRLDVALLMGLISGFFLLAKSSLRLALINSLFAPILTFDFGKKSRSLSKFFKHSLNYYFLFAIVGTLALILYNIQRLSPFFHFVAQKNLTFVMSFEEFRQTPFAYFWRNIRLIPYYIFSETTWVFALFAASGFYFLYKRDKSLLIYILIWILIPLAAIAFFAKVLFPRYLLFIAGMLLIPSSLFLSSIFKTKKRSAKIILSLLLGIFFYKAAFFDFAILFSPKDIPFPEVDRGQYIEGITAGWGIDQILEMAREKAKERAVLIITEGDFGVLGDQFEAMKKISDTKIHIKGYWPLEKDSLEKHFADLQERYVWVVTAYKKETPADWPVKKVQEFRKPNSEEKIILYELVSP